MNEAKIDPNRRFSRPFWKKLVSDRGASSSDRAEALEESQREKSRELGELESP